MPQTIRKFWEPFKGRGRLNYNWTEIDYDSVVLISVSQYDSNNIRFIGDASITVENIAPHGPPFDPNHGVTFVVNVDWGSPLNIVTDITLLDDKPIFVDFPPPPPPPSPPSNTVTATLPPPSNTNTTFNINTNNFNSNSITIDTAGGYINKSVIELIDQSIDYFKSKEIRKQGKLIIVGSGIRGICDMTLDAESQIKVAEKVLYCVADPVTERRLHLLNSSAESLYGLYANGKPRMDTYLEMLEAILSPLRAGLRVCAVFYGHPGVFAWSTHQAIRVARQEGFQAEMHPGISADASLFTDLGIDPSSHGCHSLEATDFLIHHRRLDTSAHVLLWQVECVGDFGFNFAGYKRHNFHIFIDRLRTFYPSNHPIIIYEGSQFPQGTPKIIKSNIDTITKDDLTGISTLYLPPAEPLKIDMEMVQSLGLSQQGENNE